MYFLRVLYRPDVDCSRAFEGTREFFTKERYQTRRRVRTGYSDVPDPEQIYAILPWTGGTERYHR